MIRPISSAAGVYGTLSSSTTAISEFTVSRFLAQSEQPMFCLQGFSCSSWRRIFGSWKIDTSDKALKELENIESIEFDFLIFHAFAGIIVIECKSVQKFERNRYSDSVKQLNRIDALIQSFHKILLKSSYNSYSSIPVGKVVSFPFVEMRQDVQNPYNLGKQDIESRGESWWNRILQENTVKFQLTELRYAKLSPTTKIREKK